MTIERRYKRPRVDDPSSRKAFQEIEDELYRFLVHVSERATKVTIGPTAPPHPVVGDIWIDTS